MSRKQTFLIRAATHHATSPLMSSLKGWGSVKTDGDLGCC